ncbi:hypothetical protein U9M48_012410 [Paspalum notatum var. saurae]|uniref:Uncharacterized protein n=1 Tax=Paspalum notatum var. saurae TaxID=547442 RepID=A0AAQ3WIP2_PASNO
MAYEGSGGYGTLPFAIVMSTFKRTARMRVGGRGYGGPNRIRLPTPTPPSPPPQEWVDLTESEEEDPEELVPELSEDEPEEEPQEEPLEVQPPVPPSAPPRSNPGRSRRSGVDPRTRNKIRMLVTHPIGR